MKRKNMSSPEFPEDDDERPALGKGPLNFKSRIVVPLLPAENAALDIKVIQKDRRDAGLPALIFATPFVCKDPKKIPLRKYLYGKSLIRKFVSVIIGQTGLGKSTLGAGETLAQVSAKSLLGVPVNEPLRVWLWNLEDPQEETERKLAAGMLHYGLTADDIGDRLFVDSGRDQPLVIAEMTRNGAMIVHPVVDSLVAELIRLKIDIIKIDPFVSSHTVPENDNGAMDMVVKEWGRVADRANCAVELSHHPRKTNGSEVTAEDSRGGSSFASGTRVKRPLNRMTPAEATQAGVKNNWLYFRILPDTNLAPPADKSDWFKLVSVGPAIQPLTSTSALRGSLPCRPCSRGPGPKLALPHCRPTSEALLEGEGEALTRKAIDLAKSGDMQALRLCMDRLAPPRRDSPVAFDLPEMKTVSDAVLAMGALVKAVAEGDLTPTEGAELTRMVQAFAKIIETAEIEERIRKLEEATHK
jgi:AAA domain